MQDGDQIIFIFDRVDHTMKKIDTTMNKRQGEVFLQKTSQELRMLSSVTINCQITKIAMHSGSQLSELPSKIEIS